MGRCGHRPLRTYLKFRAQTRKKPRPEAGAFIYFLLLFFFRGADDVQLVELLLRDLGGGAHKDILRVLVPIGVEYMLGIAPTGTLA